MKNLMNQNELSKMLDIQQNTICRLIVDTHLPYLVIDTRKYFDVDKINSWLETVEKKIYRPTGKDTYQLKEQQ